MTWKDRIQPSVKLTSPSGLEFTASWVGNDRTFQRKLGIFDYPGLNGVYVQDLGTSGVTYPLTLMFTGEDNDIEASRFFAACGNPGLWKIQHPTKGALNLQLVQVSEKVNPTDNGNATVFETEWLQTIQRTDRMISADHKAFVRKTTGQLNGAAALEIDNRIVENTASDRRGLVASIQGVLVAAEKTLGYLYQASGEISARVTEVRNGLLDTIEAPVIKGIGLGGQLQYLIQLPGLITGDIFTRVRVYEDLLAEVYGMSPDLEDPFTDIASPGQLRNAATIQESVLLSAVTAICLMIIEAPVDNRPDALALINRLQDLYQQALSELEKTQTLLLSRNISYQYFSADIGVSAVSGTCGYLIELSRTLAIEKRFVLREARATIEIVITEHKAIDPYYDRFIKNNGLRGNEILILPAGRGVRVYA